MVLQEYIGLWLVRDIVRSGKIGGPKKLRQMEKEKRNNSDDPLKNISPPGLRLMYRNQRHGI